MERQNDASESTYTFSAWCVVPGPDPEVAVGWEGSWVLLVVFFRARLPLPRR